MIASRIDVQGGRGAGFGDLASGSGRRDDGSMLHRQSRLS